MKRTSVRSTEQSAPFLFTTSGNHIFRWSLDAAPPLVRRLDVELHVGGVERLPSGHILVSHLDGPLQVYDEDFSLRTTLGSARPYSMAVHPLRDLIVVYDGPDDSRFESLKVSGCYNDEVTVWNSAGRPLSTHILRLGPLLALHPTEAVLATNPWRTNDLLVLDLKTGRTLFSVLLNETASCLAFSADGETIAVGTRDKRVGLFAFGSGERLLEFGRCGVPDALCLGEEHLLVASHDRKLRRIQEVHRPEPPVG